MNEACSGGFLDSKIVMTIIIVITIVMIILHDCLSVNGNDSSQDGKIGDKMRERGS